MKNIQEQKKELQELSQKLKTLTSDELEMIAGGFDFTDINGEYELPNEKVEWHKTTDEWKNEIQPTEVGSYEIYYR